MNIPEDITSLIGIGITETAFDSISALRKTIQGLREAQGDLVEIHTQLERIQHPLSVLTALELSTLSKEVLETTGLAVAVNECGQACEKFDMRIQKWKKRPIDNKLSVLDGLSVGIWNREKTRTFRTRVKTCQQTVYFALSCAELIMQAKSVHQSDAVYDRLSRQMKDLEAQAKEQLALVRNQQEQATQRGQSFANNLGDVSEDEAQSILVMEEVHEQSRLLDETQVSLGVVFAQLRVGRTHQDFGSVITDQESMAFMGLPERLVGKIDQRIGNVSTTNKSASLVGVFDHTVNLGDFVQRADASETQSLYSTVLRKLPYQRELVVSRLAILPRLARQYERLASWCRPKLRGGFSRLEWHCHCGQLFWGDFNHGHPEQLERLVLRLQQDDYKVRVISISGSGPVSGNKTQKNDLTTTPTPQSLSPSQPPAKVPLPTSRTNVLDTTSSRSSGASFLRPHKPVHLELCVNRSARAAQLGEITLVNGMGQQMVSNDQELFAKIRIKYNELKRNGLFAFLYCPQDIHYVRFGVQLGAQEAGIYQSPAAIPPRMEVDEARYHYFECPLEPLPPMPAHTFIQYFRKHAPNCASRSTLFSDRLPKKLGASMITTTGSDMLAFGWGVHIIEGPNKPILATLVAIILTASFVTSMVYNFITGSRDSGFAIGQWIVGALSAILAALYFHLQDQ